MVFRSRLLLLLAALVVSCSSDEAAHQPRAVLDELPGRVVARVTEGPALTAGPAGYVVAHESGLRLTLPLRGEAPVQLELPDGLVLRIREDGCAGPAARSGGAVHYRCGGVTSYWRQSAAGLEEWVLLPRAVSARDLVRWQVEGGRLVQHGRSVDVYDEHGLARVTISAPVAYDVRGRAIGARLTVDAQSFTVSVDELPGAGPLLIDPAWVPAGSMADARRNPSALELPDGRVLVTGGLEDSNSFGLNTAELWDPATRTFSSAAPMASLRRLHTSTLLEGGGEVLAVAGDGGDVDPATAERYDIATDVWAPAGNLSRYRHRHAAALLPDGSVLVAGGESDDTAERYDPVANAWSALPPVPCNGVGRPTVALPDGRVLVNCGGDPEQPVFDPATMSWSSTGPMARPRGTDGEKVALASGRVLAVGGGAVSFGIIATTELYDPTSNTWAEVASMDLPRHLHAAGRLDDGRVLVAGGRQGDFMYTEETEIYDELTDAWTPGPPMSTERYGHAIVELDSGELLVLGGGFLASAQLLRDGDPNGTPCTDGDDCATGFCADGVCCDEICDAGTCETCLKAMGAVEDGNCRQLSGPICDDGDSCTQTDKCLSGVCIGSDPVACTALDQCHVAGTCDSATGACSTPAKADGTPCDDSDACTQSDACQAGTCAGDDPVVCTALTQCYEPGTCDPSTGTCSTPPRPDGAACDDGDPCTQTDTCQLASCVGTEPVVCVALDSCHLPGTCDSTTGLCTDPPVADGAPCDDNDACTRRDACEAGTCAGHEPVTCAAPTQCHDSGTCDPTTGLCSAPPKPDGTSCDDSDACTQADRCQVGSCVGGDAVVCTALDGCHPAGACDPATGTCSQPIAADGAACAADGECIEGTCVEPSTSAGTALPRLGGGACSTGNEGGDPRGYGLWVLALITAALRRRRGLRCAPAVAAGDALATTHSNV